MSDHARLKPSSASQWVGCPGSVRMQELYPETEENEGARKGHAGHEVAATILGDFLECGRKGHHYKRENFLDKPASNGVIIDDDLLDAVEMYVRDVMAVSDRYDGVSWVALEHRVHMAMIHEDNWGTLDNAVLFQSEHSNTMVLGDLKLGYLIVEPWENWQLLDYAAGLLAEIYARNRRVPEFIEFRIVQPFPSHPLGKIRTWIVPVGGLDKYVDVLKASAWEALGSNPRCIPGEWCTYCTGRHKCTAALKTLYAGITIVDGVVVNDLAGAALGAHIHLLRRIEKLTAALLTGFEAQALSEIQSGRDVPGWMRDHTEGRQVWSQELDQLYALGDLMGIELRKFSAPTPKQAIALGIPENVVKSFSTKNSGKVILAPASDKKAQAIFGKQS